MRPFFFILTVMMTFSAASQPRLDLRLLRPNTPDYYYYQLYFTPYCGDSVLYGLTERQLILEEPHGTVDSNDFEIDRYASPERNSCYDIAMLVDNSSTISVEVLNRIVVAGRSFIDSMQLECQNASIISFADRPILHSFLGNDREASKIAFEEMKPGGKRVLYDAMYAGMVEMITNGRQGQELIFAVTTGPDNGSSTSTEQLLKTARNNRFRVFVFGLGMSSPPPDLMSLCRESGGLYFSIPVAEDLTVAFTDFEGFIQREYDEYRLVRRTRNPDMRDMLIRLRLEACDDSVWVERHFLFDGSATSVNPVPVEIGLDACYPNPVGTGQTLHIPITVRSGGVGEIVTVRVYDVLGRPVTSITDVVRTSEKQTLDVTTTGLRPGAYIIQFHRGAEVRHAMFVIRP
ncbi:MAG: VWA domain-containing protein [Bacteroidia bacterium]|nr:VWA domain-containing protein [Bacteroidia bacterium]